MKIFVIFREERPVVDSMSGRYHFYSNEAATEKGVKELQRWNIQKNPVNYEIRELEIDIENYKISASEMLKRDR